MSNALIAGLLNRLNENQLALGAAVEELTVWVEQRGAEEVAGNVRSALETLDENFAAIKRGVMELSLLGVAGI
ncbi:hypothetical protein [Pseudomonas sp. dw_358]|uniref:hypothetical protein n=1 Tax=Pseudomonas sp. dw_358 TaxID=2720083 RepID=UPI001BD26B47|nr:hypothetical protein [Pseudomonas sp. dw_358]